MDLLLGVFFASRTHVRGVGGDQVASLVVAPHWTAQSGAQSENLYMQPVQTED